MEELIILIEKRVIPVKENHMQHRRKEVDTYQQPLLVRSTPEKVYLTSVSCQVRQDPNQEDLPQSQDRKHQKRQSLLLTILNPKHGIFQEQKQKLMMVN